MRRWVGRALVVSLVAAGLGVVTSGLVPCAVLVFQPECYVALRPGPAEDALRRIHIEDHPTYASAGALLLTTVAVDTRLDLREWLSGLISPGVSQLPREALFPSGDDRQDLRRRTDAQMRTAQLSATVAALRVAGHPADTDGDGARVVVVRSGSRADGVVEPGDVIVEVDGRPVRGAAAARTAIDRHAHDRPATLTVRRDGIIRQERLPATDAPSRAGLGEQPQPAASGDAGPRPGGALGMRLADHLALPVDVRIDTGEIGGPSAGLMLALGILDRLDPADLTGGAVIAGTGTLGPDGAVGPVSGIRQKLEGAGGHRSRPASAFLVPRANVGELHGLALDRRVLVIPVDTLDQALTALSHVRAGTRPSGAFEVGPS